MARRQATRRASPRPRRYRTVYAYPVWDAVANALGVAMLLGAAYALAVY